MADIAIQGPADLTALEAARIEALSDAGQGSFEASVMEVAISSLLDSGLATQRGDDGLVFLLGAAAASLQGRPKRLAAGFEAGIADIRARKMQSVTVGLA